VLGTITWTDANESTLMEWLERGIQFNYGALRAGPVPMERYFYTSNVSIPAAIVGGLGGFDPRFETAAMEDIELGWRLRQAGTELVYQPELVVVHDHPTSYAESLQRMERIGAGAAQLMTIHPDAQAIGVSRAGRPKALLLHALSRLLFPRRELPALPPALRDLRWRIIHLDAFYGGYWRARAGR
jgi:GT2 family glycosyltransferase